MPNVNIRSSECSWFQTELSVFGRVVKGLRGWEFKKTTEKEPLYGAGQHAIDIQEGNIKCDGHFKLLGFEVDALNTAANVAGYDDITAVPHEAIVAVLKFKKSKLDPKTMVTIVGISFSETGGSMDQGAKMREVTLPWIAMDIISLTI
jgi:hypothetical protein